MHRFQRGDAQAFNTIYNRFFTPLRHFSGRLTCQKQFADDITIETFAKLYRLCANFDNVANVKAFLYVTARNACYDHLAYSHRTVQGPSIHNRPSELRSLHAINHESQLAEVLKTVQEAVDSLPAENGRVLKLAYQQGYKNAGIAQELGLTESAVRSYRRGGIKLLRIALFREQQPEAALNCLNLVRMQEARQVAAEYSTP